MTPTPARVMGDSGDIKDGRHIKVTDWILNTARKKESTGEPHT